MIHAYEKNYLDKAQATLASMLDYAINDLSLDISTFFDLFIASGKAALFETGDPNTLAGRSGAEYLLMLASALHCNPINLIERINQ